MNKFLLAFIGLTLTFGLSAAEFKEGEHYIKIENQQAASEKGVTEFFSFYCPACYQFEEIARISDAIKNALKSDVKYKKFHVDFLGGELGKKMTQAWAVALSLGVENSIKAPMFNAVQNARSIRSEKDIRQIFLDAGVSVEDYDNAWDSFVVKSLVVQQQKAAEAYQLTGVPSVYVNGQYQVRSASLSSLNDFVEVTQFLLNK